MKRFALIGAAGYIAPRHMKAIKLSLNKVVAAVDKSDSVGVLDSYFPDADFFTEFERFDRHIEKLRQNEETKVDYVSICSPNYLHDAHIRFALRVGADAICEKPLVLNPWNLDALKKFEEQTGRKVYTILQLRCHPSLIHLKKMLAANHSDKKHNVELRYMTPRGKWYNYSWKADINKSGGLVCNIGIHLFDILLWLFGPCDGIDVVENWQNTRRSGRLKLRDADVSWFLSIDSQDAPDMKPKRILKIDDQVIDFSEGINDLHTQNYALIFGGGGFGIEDARGAIELAYRIRSA